MYPTKKSKNAIDVYLTIDSYGDSKYKPPSNNTKIEEYIDCLIKNDDVFNISTEKADQTVTTKEDEYFIDIVVTH